MLPECPDDLKHLLPYLQRASELKSREPVIAYYCGFYAANLALTKGYPKNQTNDSYLMALFDELEKEKLELLQDPAMNDAEAARSMILQFAMRIFLAADNEDRAGQATKKTARLFLVSSQFLEVARVLETLPEEVEDRIKYAKWKAADIIKALNEGRQPLAGPPGGGGEAKRDSPTGDTSNLPSLSGQFHPTSPATTSTSPPPPAPLHRASPPIVLPSINVPGPVSIAAPAVARDNGGSSYPSSAERMTCVADAEKYARYAVSAIQFEDISTAIKNLERALQVLHNLNSNK